MHEMRRERSCWPSNARKMALRYRAGPHTARAPGPCSRPPFPPLTCARRRCIRSASSSHQQSVQVEQSSSDAPEPVIKVEAASPSGAPAAFTVPSGEEVLRSALLAEKVELYSLWGKVSNCGGGGSCGTCIVEVLSGAELLSERTDAEQRKLKSKPASWRLACQAIVGDGSNAGSLSVRTQPK